MYGKFHEKPPKIEIPPNSRKKNAKSAVLFFSIESIHPGLSIPKESLLAAVSAAFFSKRPYYYLIIQHDFRTLDGVNLLNLNKLPGLMLLIVLHIIRLALFNNNNHLELELDFQHHVISPPQGEVRSKEHSKMINLVIVIMTFTPLLKKMMRSSKIYPHIMLLLRLNQGLPHMQLQQPTYQNQKSLNKKLDCHVHMVRLLLLMSFCTSPPLLLI